MRSFLKKRKSIFCNELIGSFSFLDLFRIRLLGTLKLPSMLLFLLVQNRQQTHD